MVLESRVKSRSVGQQVGVQAVAAECALWRRADSSLPDKCVAALSLAVFALWIYAFQYRGSLGEEDLYRVLDGLLDGARSGTGFASVLHYGKDFSFGYIAAIFRFADTATLQDPRRLIALINGIGFLAAVVGSAGFWWSTRLLYGARAATVALILFAFSPMMLDLGTSGHQILVAFALFEAACVVLFLPLVGLPAAICSLLGSLLLLAALVSRAEIFLAFPFVVLARADLGSVQRFSKSVAVKAIGPALSLGSFFLLKHFCVHLSAREAALSGGFFNRWYSFANIPEGVVVYLVGCGFVTTLAGLFAAIYMVRAMAAGPDEWAGRYSLMQSAGSAFALLLPPLAFWICNPQPARHFILCLAGTAILIGLLVQSWLPPPRWVAAYALVLGVVLANQGVGAISGPVILQHSPSPWTAAPGHSRLTTRAPIGSSWNFHQTVQAERWRTDAFAEKVRGTCDQNTIVFSDRARQIFWHFYQSPTHWFASIRDLGSLETMVVQSGDRTVMLVTEMGDGWTHDAVSEVLANRALSKYGLVRDPDTVSIYDKTAIPLNRQAHLGCTP